MLERIVAGAGTNRSTMQDDRPVTEFSKFLTKSEVSHFSQISSWRFFGAVAIEVLTIVLAIYLSERYWNIPLYIAVVIVIGSRMHALAVLMHDATHYRASSNRRINEFTGEVLALLVSITMQGYRNTHFAHHRELNTENDPDWIRKLGAPEFSFPKSPRAIILMLSQYALGLKSYGEAKKIKKMKNMGNISTRLKILRAAFILLIIASAILFGFWKQLILYWPIPLVTSFMFFLQIRSVAEHFAVEYQHMLNHTRTVVAPFWERWLFAPHGVNYHLEHHLYPSVPFFQLPRLHRYLMTKDEFARSAHITKGYTTGLFRECCTAIQAPDAA
jgi:fatty acid desaturase